ncbi:unnamed protein product [Ambrosiozyma monospora]|uniref:Unnamed protein product n=1 Tax=Ambrosiozyma monospora TaxID=43982 RepID=A0A9W6YR85_AMBMO|nr:unnamed protein product [Ambrosiozyma monospora]
MGAVCSCLIPQSDTSSQMECDENAPLLPSDENENRRLKFKIREAELTSIINSIYYQLVEITSFYNEEQQIQQSGLTLAQRQQILTNAHPQTTQQAIIQQQPTAQSNMTYGATMANNNSIDSIKSPDGNTSDYDDLVNLTQQTLSDTININVVDETVVSEDSKDIYPEELNKFEKYLTSKFKDADTIKVTPFLDD